MGPPLLRLYPVEPVGVAIINPSAQYLDNFILLIEVSMLMRDAVFFLETVISFNAYGNSNLIFKLVFKVRSSLFTKLKFFDFKKLIPC